MNLFCASRWLSNVPKSQGKGDIMLSIALLLLWSCFECGVLAYYKELNVNECWHLFLTSKEKLNMGGTKILEKGTKVVPDMKRKAKQQLDLWSKEKISEGTKERWLAFSEMKIHGRRRTQRLKNFPSVLWNS